MMNSLENFFHLFTLDSAVPVIDKTNWQNLLEEYGKDDVKLALATYIDEWNPPFPYRNIPIEKVRTRFRKLYKTSMQKMLIQEDVKVLEKFEYENNYDKCGLGLIQMGNSYNSVSDYFQNKNRMSCGSYGFRSPVWRWEHGDLKDITQLISPIFRLTETNPALTTESYRQAFRLGSYVASQFKPNVAKLMYEMHDAKNIFDMSCGWGDRLAGFWATPGTTLYVGCDPNENTFAEYKTQCLFYHNELGGGVYSEKEDDDYYEFVGRKHVIIYNLPAEDLPWEDLPPVDLAFSSPPYFSTERYNDDSDRRDLQSWKRYVSFEAWRDNFLMPVLSKQFDLLVDGGYMLVNIIDPKIKTAHYPLCDYMVDKLGQIPDCNFLGQLGMRMMQRMKTLKEDEKDEFYDSIFIEPVWTFRKGLNKYETTFDVNTLEEFFV